MKINPKTLFATYIRRYPITCVLIVVIWYLSFFTVPKTELGDVPFIDKWTHIAMYGGTCAVLWIEYIRSHTTHNKVRLFVWAWVAPIVMSAVIEVLQEYCTGGRRSGDWEDLIANILGVTLGAMIGLAIAKWRKGAGR